MGILTGRHALVTGAGRGIGRATAAALTEAGASVTVMGRHAQDLEAVVGRGCAMGFFTADVTDAAALRVGIEAAANARGAFDILVANAGGAESAPFLKTSDDQFRLMIDVNLMGTVHAVRAVLGAMVERGFGRVVAIASTAGLKGAAYVSAYTAAKHAVVGLVRALGVETARTGVTVNAVCPSFTDTDLVGRSLAAITAKTGRTEEQALADMLRSQPLGRLIAPEEVAAAVLYLCSPGAGAITGATLSVAGGEV